MERNVWLRVVGWFARSNRQIMDAEEFYTGHFFRETEMPGVVFAELISIKQVSAVCGVYEVRHIHQEKRGDRENRSVRQTVDQWVACFSSSRRQLMELEGGRVLSAIPEKQELHYKGNAFNKTKLETVTGS